MKRALKVIAIIAALCTVLAVSAFAAYYDHCADALNELGLFKGTQNGYELDREPTRAEAATMLVRLLGAEEEALALTYTAPYKDVETWAKPYVQYLHDNGLTKGTSETTFGYSDKCTAQQYATFLLRALGFSDGENGDFTYDDALSFAQSKGVYDEARFGDRTFLRDHVAAMSYAALATEPKSGEADLLSKLVASGAVSDAKGHDEFFANYRAYCKDMKKFVDSKAYSWSGKSVSNIISDGAESTTEVSVAVAAKFNTDEPNKSEMLYEYDSTAVAPGEEKNTSYMRHYYKDGVMYSDVDNRRSKAELPLEAMLYIVGVTVNQNMESIATIESIDIKALSDGSAEYTVKYEDLAESLEPEHYFTENSTAIVTVKNGVPVYIKFLNENVMKSGDLDVKRESEQIIENIKLGDDVSIAFPEDLDTYEAPDLGAAGTSENSGIAMMEEGKMRIGITQFEPMNYYDSETNELTGFETEFAKALCEKIGVEAEFVEIAWDAKLAALNSGQIDCVWNGLTVTDERKAEMEISSPYMRNALLPVAKEENASKYSQSIGNAKVAAEPWFEEELANNKLFADAEILTVDSANDALASVLSGEADMALVDGITTAYALVKDTAFEGLAFVGSYEIMPEEYGIAFRMGSDITEINAAIEEMIDDGTLEKIAKKYNLERFLIK